jgi:hypothetical protein
MDGGFILGDQAGRQNSPSRHHLRQPLSELATAGRGALV